MVPRRSVIVLVVSLAASAVLSMLGRFAELLESPVLENALAGASLVSLALAIPVSARIASSLVATRRELHHRLEALAATAATTHDWLWETDAHHRLTYSSRGVEELLGHPPTEVVGMLSTDYLYGADNRTIDPAHPTSGPASPDRWEEVEVAWRHRDGHPVVLSGSAAAIHDESGRLLGYRGTRRPLTDSIERGAVLAARQRVRAVLETRAVSSALQPIVNVGTGATVGVEALARFHDRRTPDMWFRDAEIAGLHLELDELTFMTALEQLSSLPEHLHLSVNASPELLMNSPFRTRLLASDLPFCRLVIEITEHARVSDYLRLLGALQELRERGARFAIDDTGAGYASLMHVIQLKPDVIKLDRALIQDLDTDRARRSLVTALVLLALDVGASVTGEGVETPAQLSALSSLGVDNVQGFLLAKPSQEPGEWSTWWSRQWSHHPEAPDRIRIAPRQPHGKPT